MSAVAQTPPQPTTKLVPLHGVKGFSDFPSRQVVVFGNFNAAMAAAKSIGDRLFVVAPPGDRSIHFITDWAPLAGRSIAVVAGRIGSRTRPMPK